MMKLAELANQIKPLNQALQSAMKASYLGQLKAKASNSAGSTLHDWLTPYRLPLLPLGFPVLADSRRQNVFRTSSSAV